MKQTQNKKILKDTFWYSAGTYIPKVFKIFFDIFTRRIVLPELFGINTFRMVLVSYFDIPFQLIREAIGREVPYMRGAGRSQELAQLVNTSFLMTVIGLVVSTMVYGVLFVFAASFQLRVAIGFAFITTILTTLVGFIQRLNAADKKFEVIGKGFLLSGLLGPPAILAGAYLFGFWGFFIFSLVETTVFGIVIIIKGAKYSFIPTIDREMLKVIFKVGTPLIIYSFILINVYNADKIFIQMFMSLESLGLYSIGAALFMMLILISAPLYAVQYPYLLEQMGNGEISDQEIHNKIKTTTTFVKLFVQAISAGLIVVFPVIIYFLLPKYCPIIFPTQVLMLALYFNSVYALYSYYLIGKKMFMHLILIALITLAFTVLMYFLLFWFRLISLSWVALVVLAWSVLLCYQIKFLGIKYLSGDGYWADLFAFLIEDAVFICPSVILIAITFFKMNLNMAAILFINIAVFVAAEIILGIYAVRKQPGIFIKLMQLVRGNEQPA